LLTPRWRELDSNYQFRREEFRFRASYFIGFLDPIRVWDAQIALLAASMKEWGWTNPVLADEAGGVIAGHARILAARQLGYGEVPVMGRNRPADIPRISRWFRCRP
jgi:hypothetical protein